jgi:hypothetical protein
LPVVHYIAAGHIIALWDHSVPVHFQAHHGSAEISWSMLMEREKKQKKTGGF